MMDRELIHIGNVKCWIPKSSERHKELNGAIYKVLKEGIGYVSGSVHVYTFEWGGPVWAASTATVCTCRKQSNEQLSNWAQIY
jgi:hypothetical protein